MWAGCRTDVGSGGCHPRCVFHFVLRTDFANQVHHDGSRPSLSMRDAYFQRDDVTIYNGDCLEVLREMPQQSIHTCVTSPPYWQQRDYGVADQLGSESTPGAYVKKLVAVAREIWRVLRDDGTFWLNLGDKYCSDSKWGGSSGNKNETKQGYPRRRKRGETGLKDKDLIGIPWMVAFALRDAGWYLRQDCVWSKPNPMPGSMTDRCTSAHEYVFLLAKSRHYFYDHVAIMEDSVCAEEAKYDDGTNGLESGTSYADSGRSTRKFGRDPDKRNKRSVWEVPVNRFKGAHFATFPPALIEPCIMAGSSEFGCCPTCQRQHQRVTETVRTSTRPGTDTNVGGRDSSEVGNRDPQRHVTDIRTIGSQPDCSCSGGEPVPCVVLDPFLGSGTTADLSQRLGRKCIGIEMNADYCKLAAKRFHQRRLLS